MNSYNDVFYDIPDDLDGFIFSSNLGFRLDYEKCVEVPPPSEMGYKFHVIIFDKEDKREDFQCVLHHPKTYIKSLLDSNHSGFILKIADNYESILNNFNNGIYGSFVKGNFIPNGPFQISLDNFNK